LKKGYKYSEKKIKSTSPDISCLEQQTKIPHHRDPGKKYFNPLEKGRESYDNGLETGISFLSPLQSRFFLVKIKPELEPMKQPVGMTNKEIKLTVDTPGNELAIAVGQLSPQKAFVEVNRVFSTIFSAIDTPEKLFTLISGQSENKTIISFNESHWELLQLKINASEILYLLKNVSFERLVLKRLKEQLKDLTDTNELYGEVLDKNLPLGVLIVDGDFNAIFANGMLRRYFHIPQKATLKKCYNFVKGIKPCDDCILKGIAEGGERRKKNYETDEGYLITAEIHPVADYDIITFRDTTREINLIQEIKKQQEALETANRMIATQNDILKRLSNISIRIGQMRDVESLLEAVVKAIIDTFSCQKGAILLFEEGGKIKNAFFSKDIDDRERDFIIQSIGIGQKYSQELYFHGDHGTTVYVEELNEYIIQDIVDNDKLIGRIFLSHPQGIIDQSILELFLMQVCVYLNNVQLQRKLEEIAHTDALTGVFNRYYFDHRFQEEKELSLRFGQALALILVDLNGLKKINDTVGHQAGDIMIQETTRLLAKSLSRNDSIYRIGGDEFVILLANCPEDRLNIIMDILKELQQDAIFLYNDQSYPLFFSLGGACSTEVDYSQLRVEADKRMFLDKRNFYESHQRYR